MKTKTILILIVILACLLLTGCYDSKKVGNNFKEIDQKFDTKFAGNSIQVKNSSCVPPCVFLCVGPRLNEVRL